MVHVFPYLAIRSQADDVPTTVVNGHKTLVGTFPEAEAVAVARRMATVAGPAG